MSRITESAIEQLAIDKLEVLGYQYLYGPVIAVDGEHQKDNPISRLFYPVE